MTLKELDQITSAPAEAPPGRLSFQDAAAAVVANSRLKALQESGQPEEWPTALNEDCGAANALFQILAADLSKITGLPVTIRPFTVTRLNDAISQHYPDTATRLKALAEEFAKVFAEDARRLINSIAGNAVLDGTYSHTVQSGRREIHVYNKTVFPLTPVRHVGDTAIFFALGAGVGGEKLYEVTLATYAYVHPDDHVMKVPSSVQAKVAALRTTTLDYSPKILRGTQIAKKEVALHKEIVYERYDPDPALVINFGLDYPPHVVEFWEEPFHRNHSTPANPPAFAKYAKKAGASFLFTLLGVFGFVGMYFYSDPHEVVLTILAGIICFVVVVSTATHAVQTVFQYFKDVESARDSIKGVERHPLSL